MFYRRNWVTTKVARLNNGRGFDQLLLGLAGASFLISSQLTLSQLDALRMAGAERGQAMVRRGLHWI